MVESLEKILEYTFENKDLLLTAITHKSFAHENKTENYERLEFLGDSVLSCVISHFLFNKFKDLQEGQLSTARSNLVNETRLFEISKKLDLQKYIKLGIGESNSKLVSPSIIADCFEAIVGAIYLDGGNVPAHEFIYMAFEDVLEKSDYLLVDSKTRLQEEIQKRFKTAPIYQLIGTCGSGHYKTFEVEIVINGHSISTGLGSSKKVAEMNAAKNCLLQLLGPATNKISY